MGLVPVGGGLVVVLAIVGVFTLPLAMTIVSTLYRWILGLDEPVPAVAANLRLLGRDPAEAHPVTVAALETGLYVAILATASAALGGFLSLGMPVVVPEPFYAGVFGAVMLGALLGERDKLPDSGRSHVVRHLVLLYAVWQVVGAGAFGVVELLGVDLLLSPVPIRLTIAGFVLGTVLAVALHLYRDTVDAEFDSEREVALAGLAVVVLGLPFVVPVSGRPVAGVTDDALLIVLRHLVSAAVVVALVAAVSAAEGGRDGVPAVSGTDA